MSKNFRYVASQDFDIAKKTKNFSYIAKKTLLLPSTRAERSAPAVQHKSAVNEGNSHEFAVC